VQPSNPSMEGNSPLLPLLLIFSLVPLVVLLSAYPPQPSAYLLTLRPLLPSFLGSIPASPSHTSPTLCILSLTTSSPPRHLLDNSLRLPSVLHTAGSRRFVAAQLQHRLWQAEPICGGIATTRIPAPPTTRTTGTASSSKPMPATPLSQCPRTRISRTGPDENTAPTAALLPSTGLCGSGFHPGRPTEADQVCTVGTGEHRITDAAPIIQVYPAHARVERYEPLPHHVRR